MPPEMLEIYAPITKREKDPKTGHLYVYGKMTGPGLDHDQQRMSADWLKTAVPAWFKSAANVREQHDSKRAIGKGIHLEERDDDWYLGAKIVDKAAIEKAEEEVLTGFSIGVKGYRLDFSNKTEAPNGTCVSGRICEVSLVDAPCLPDALIEDRYRLALAKADSTGELQPIDDPELERVNSPMQQQTYGLLPELFDRLPSPARQALADLAAAGATVTAHVEKADADNPEPIPVVVNVTVQTEQEPDTDSSDAQTEAADVIENVDVADLDKGYTAEQKRQALADGQAIRNAKGEPSYVVKTKADLRRAIKAVGRGGAEHDAIRKYILTRAKALGLEGMVPDNWNADGSLKGAEAAKAILADLEALGITPEPDLGKADGESGQPPAQDVADAKSAIGIIGKLIVSEAQSLAVGNLNEACDIQLLLQAVNALKWFICAENREPVDADGDEISLADEPEFTKAEPAPKKKGKKAGKGKQPPVPMGEDSAARDNDDTGGGDDDGAAQDGDAENSAGRKKNASATKTTGHGPDILTKADFADLIKAMTREHQQAAEKAVSRAVAETKAASEERITALEADLVKARTETQAELADALAKLPLPGGPALTRTSAAYAQAGKTRAEVLSAEAEDLMAKAERYSSNRDLAEGYRERARELRTKAADLANA